ncbi:hypothetical protein MANES_10G038141v8 [Manihot esculenta]|uniref:Uncharacterized protein n=1 Tax=Manihot esculenta TaxID=3983 RepID=A0ACB7GZR7_MANES|nr:hypothetical protein MANES_10G038141v8 [Manihot esculenta]
MSHNYNVYVSAIYGGSRQDNSLSTSKFSIILRILSSFISEIKDPSDTTIPFSFPCHSLTSDDGAPSWACVSRMLSHSNISFTLDRIQWRQNDVIRQILGFARRKASVINDQHKELNMLVIIKKETVLAADEFEAMFNARRVEQVYAALAWANEQERSSLQKLLTDTKTFKYLCYKNSLISFCIR